VLIKTLFYTGVRVSELVTIRLQEVDLERCQIRIQQGIGDAHPVYEQEMEHVPIP